MAGRDGLGPMGMGPMTGRGLGFCDKGFYGRRNCYGMGFGKRGYGPGYGAGYGYGPRYYREDIRGKEFLQEQKEFLESQIDYLNGELEKLDADDNDK